MVADCLEVSDLPHSQRWTSWLYEGGDAATLQVGVGHHFFNLDFDVERLERLSTGAEFDANLLATIAVAVGGLEFRHARSPKALHASLRNDPLILPTDPNRPLRLPRRPLPR